MLPSDLIRPGQIGSHPHRAGGFNEVVELGHGPAPEVVDFALGRFGHAGDNVHLRSNMEKKGRKPWGQNEPRPASLGPGWKCARQYGMQGVARRARGWVAQLLHLGARPSARLYGQQPQPGEILRHQR